MTDSGFSSAASQRSASSIIRPALINSFSSSLKPDIAAVPLEKDERGSNDALPKPCIQYPSNFGRSSIPNRLIYEKNHGGYSPGLSPYSHPELSPMSSLTYDFKDLSTSHSSADTPRKRLSLSSLSSLDSPHPSGSSCFGYSSLSHNSPLLSGLSNSRSSNDAATSNSSDGRRKICGVRQAVLVRNCFGKERKIFVPVAKASQGSNRGSVSQIRGFEPIAAEGLLSETAGLSDDGKENQKPVKVRAADVPLPLKKAGSVSRIKGRRSRALVLQGRVKTCAGDGVYAKPSKQKPNNHSAPYNRKPIGFSENFSPIGKSYRRTKTESALMSSPLLVNHFQHGKSSAFKTVRSGDSRPARQILGDIDGNVPAASRSLDEASKQAGVKRVLEDSAVSGSGTSAPATRKRKCSKSLNAKSAFAQERKTKSADAILSGRRPVPVFADVTEFAGRKFGCRALSAPIVTGEDDDDYVLSHSSLCSRDSDDEDLKANSSTERFSSSSSCREEEIANMLAENVKESAGCDSERSSSDTPRALDGLISGVLLLGDGGSASAGSSCNDTTDSISALGCAKSAKVDDLLRPRELFRSPSAPPLVPSRRALMKLKRGGRNCERSSNDTTPVSIKRPRTFASLTDESGSPKLSDPGLNRSRSYNELDIMKAVDDGCRDQELVGDFSRKCSLPTVTGRKQDLKYISSATLSQALKKEHGIGMLELVDCRYTYEYEGGHIAGAHNIYTEEQLVERYFNCAKPLWARAKQHQTQTGDARPHVLVFHCEFSSERAPRLARFLRNYDRSLNTYPALHYPEIYLLKDGYKEFFKLKKEHCDPRGYIPMSHEDYAGELRKFRIKSKTWAGEKSKQGLLNRLKSR